MPCLLVKSVIMLTLSDIVAPHPIHNLSSMKKSHFILCDNHRNFSQVRIKSFLNFDSLSNCLIGFLLVCPRMLSYFLKVMWQSVLLFLSLFWSAKPDFILVQNPPSVPTLPVCWFVCWLRGVPLVIDWHNYGYTILSLTLGPRHLLVLMSRLIEKKFGRKAQSNLCVTKAMSVDLQQNWGIT